MVGTDLMNIGPQDGLLKRLAKSKYPDLLGRFF